jgi:hypothetical protein
LIVTGRDVFYYLKCTEQSTIKTIVNNFKADADTSKDFTCHAWLADGKFILCTKEGQILQCEANGEYKKVMIFDPKKPTKTAINSVLPFVMGSGPNSKVG